MEIKFNIQYYFQFLSKFILFTIFTIKFNPYKFKCCLFFTKSATCLKSAKSKAFIPNIGYSVKNGIILLLISEVLFIWSKAIFDFSLLCTELTLFDLTYKSLK